MNLQEILEGLPKAPILGESGPLRWKQQADGRTRLQGIYRMKDEVGFPIDMSYEYAREKGWEIDWVEALADALSQCILKYDALIEEIRMLEPAKLEGVIAIFSAGLMSCEGPTACDKAVHLHRRMRGSN